MVVVKKRISIRNRLLTRLLISHGLIVSIPLLITGRVLVGTAQESIQETILTRDLEFAKRSTRFVEVKLSTATELLRTLAQFQTIFHVNRREQELAVNTLVSEFDVFHEVSILDTLGHVLASTSFENPPTGRMSGDGFLSSVLLSFEHRDRYRSGVYISSERLPMMDMAEPIKQYDETIGILYATVDLKAMWDLVDENKVGELGEAFIFNADGFFIAHSDRRNVYSEKRFRNREVKDAVRAGHSGQLIYTTDDGIEMVAAYAPIGNYGWGAMLQQPTSEAFEPAIRMRFRVFQFIVIGIVLASLLAFFYSKWIVKPVNLLVSGMDRFSRGDLTHRIEKVTDDEVGMLTESFNEMADRLIEVQNKLKRAGVLFTLRKLASVLSHEIRNPLNSMVINMQILKREFLRERIDKKRVEKFYGVLEAEIKRVDQLVTDFLMVARPPKTEKAEVSINEVLDEVLVIQVADSLKKGVRIERMYDATPIMAHVEVDKIRQVFLNLTLNAIQAMPGGGRLRVSLRLSNQRKSATNPVTGKAVVISFTDTGHGIKKEDLGKIFDFYFSTKEDGSGLGLAIVQQIIDEHHGHIAVTSTEGKGTTIKIYLPVSASSTSEQPAEST